MRQVTRHAQHIEVAELEDGTLHVNKIFDNKKALEQNKMIRSNNLMQKGELGLHDGADIRMGISIPSNIEYELFKKNHPDIYKGLKSNIESERMDACRSIAILEPEWIVQTRL